MVQKDGNWQWLLEGFKFDLEAQVRPRTVEYYCDLARIFVQWVESAGIDKPELLTKRDINRFFHYLTHESPTARQSNNSGEWAHRAESLRFHYYRGIKRFCGWLEAERHVEQNPLVGIVFRPPRDAPIEPYNQEHIEKLFAVLDYDWKVAKTPRQKMLAARDKAIICLFFESGLRLGELTALSLRDIDLNEQRIAVWYGKQGKSRVTGFGPQTKKALWRYISLRPNEVERDKLWVTERGKPISAAGIQQIMRRVKRDAGLQHLRGLLHKCRHTFATDLLEHTGDMKACQTLLGHSTLRMTQRYTEYVQVGHALKYFNGTGPLDWMKKKGAK
jgi:site-specific recombinase XerD